MWSQSDTPQMRDLVKSTVRRSPQISWTPEVIFAFIMGIRSQEVAGKRLTLMEAADKYGREYPDWLENEYPILMRHISDPT